MTDCGESTGTIEDRQRNMPLCVEVEIHEGTRQVGYLSLLIENEKFGLVGEGMGLYSGFVEAKGTRIDLRKLSDILSVKEW